MNHTTKIASAALLFLAAGCASPTDDGWEIDGAGAPVDAAVVQELQRGGTAQAIVRFEADIDLSANVDVVQKRYDRLPLVSVTIGSMEQLEQVAHRRGVVRVYADLVVHATAMVDGLNLVGQPEAATAGLDGDGAAVVVIDTGADFTQADFGSCSAAGAAGCRIVAAKDFAPDDATADDSTRHGTNVAGIVAAVAPRADIIALDVFDGHRASSRDILSAVDWAITNRDRYGIAAINMSLGTDEVFGSACDDSVFAPAIEEALHAGIVTVTSSGNGGSSTGVSAPGCVSAALTVGAVHATKMTAAYPVCVETNAPADSVTCFTNSSRQVDVLAPGSRVDAGGVIMSGTSQASPHVAAAVAAVAAASAGEAQDWIDTIVNTGVPRVDARNGLTFPRLDLAAAAASLAPAPVEPPVEEPPVEEPPVEEPPVQQPPAITPPKMPAPPIAPPKITPPKMPRPSLKPFVAINDDDETTEGLNVTLTISAPRATLMCISNTTSCDRFVEFNGEVEWKLGAPEADGLHHVYVYLPSPSAGQFRNLMVTDSIVVR